MSLGTAPTAPRLEDHSGPSSQLIELLTVAEIAALLKVSRSWVYEHTRLRNAPRSDRLPHVKIGKYLRFDPHFVNNGYAPRTTDHIHDVLSAILRTAVKWGHLQENPARNVDLPVLTTVRPKWALTVEQASALIQALPAMPKTMVGVALLTGLRRGELFALRWRDLDEERQCLYVREAVYEGKFGTPKTAAGVRQIPLSEGAVKLIVDWREQVKRREPEALMFSTWSGKPISPNNVVRRWIVPACEALGIVRATWLTLRRTYSSWAHEKGVPGKVIAQLMGHAKVDTTLNVYTQVVDGSLRRAADTVGSELFTIVHNRAASPLEVKGQGSNVKGAEVATTH